MTAESRDGTREMVDGAITVLASGPVVRMVPAGERTPALATAAKARTAMKAWKQIIKKNYKFPNQILSPLWHNHIISETFSDSLPAC